MNTLELTKFDVAERQLLQSIKMFFGEEDPVSIHTLAEAAAQILSDISKSYGTRSYLRNSELIKPEKKKEWFQHIFKSRNFFKHANNDGNEKHIFNCVCNDLTLIDAVHIYSVIKKRWVPETSVFHAWFLVEHPSLIREGTEVHSLYSKALETNTLPNTKKKRLFLKLIEQLRSKQIIKESVVLEYGL
jgi:hypothetical protein